MFSGGYRKRSEKHQKNERKTLDWLILTVDSPLARRYLPNDVTIYHHYPILSPDSENSC